MAPLTKESELSGQTNMAGTPPSAKPQPLAVEIPVTVNGACAVAGSDKREPFSETTQTVLVFSSGAVIRLAARVGPGQLLFVTNEKSRKEVVCQVVKSKQNGSAGGYVELKFTEPAADFWGVHLPGAPPTPLSPASTPAATISLSSLPTKTLEERITELNSTTSPAPTATTLKPIQAAPLVPALPRAPIAMPAPEMREPKLAPVVTLPSPGFPPAATTLPAPASKVPTLSEFLTHGANGLGLSVDKGKATKLPPQADEIKLEESTTPSPSVLPAPSAPRASDSTPGLSVALGIKQNPAPGTLTFDLAAEEVKIPAWLEPLARNSTPQAQESKQAEGKVAETKASEQLDQLDTPVVAATSQSEDADSDNLAVFTIPNEGRAPNFGSSLPLGGQAEEAKGSGMGLKIALLIAALLLTAAAVWYWYVNQPLKVAASGNTEPLETTNASAPAPDSGASMTEPAASSPSELNPVSSKGAEPTAPAPAATASAPARSPATIARAARVEPPVETPAPPAAVTAKKPALGDVHLAAPVVAHRAAIQENGAGDPGLALGGVSGGDPNSLSLLASRGKEPAAPIPVGGEVKAAKLVSSVPPAYPQLARSQRLSGDVTLDALIDINGRVSATKVLSGPALLHQSAIDAVKQWKYQPATLNGQPTPMHLTVTVQFRLQ